MKAVADTSSLLSLEYMEILEDSLDIIDIYTTGSVKEELIEITNFRDEKSKIARKILDLVLKDKIRCIETRGGSPSKHPPVNQCLYLCINARIPVLLTDDADTSYLSGRMVSQKGVKLRMCASVLSELIKANKISAPDARAKIKELIKKRSWEGGILEVLVQRYMQKGR
jgi:rRNA-processing protein FCF1